MLIPAIVVLTSVWVLFDARKLGLKKGQVDGILNMGYIEWFIVCIGLWLFAFPIYLINRNRLKKAACISDVKCPQCQTLINSESQFCTECGSKLGNTGVNTAATTSEKSSRSIGEIIAITIVVILTVFVLFIFMIGFIG